MATHALIQLVILILTAVASAEEDRMLPMLNQCPLNMPPVISPFWWKLIWLLFAWPYVHVNGFTGTNRAINLLHTSLLDADNTNIYLYLEQKPCYVFDKNKISSYESFSSSLIKLQFLTKRMREGEGEKKRASYQAQISSIGRTS